MTTTSRHGQALMLTALFGGAVACGGTQPGSDTTSGEQSIAAAADDATTTSTVQPNDSPCVDHNDDGVCDSLQAEGRMTGGGKLRATDGSEVTHGFELRCDAKDHRQNLTVRWGKGKTFHLETLNMAFCTDQADSSEGNPVAGFDTFIGMGEGRLNGNDSAVIVFAFTDAGEPGTKDVAAITIQDAEGHELVTAFGTLTGGNHQAHALTEQ